MLGDVYEDTYFYNWYGVEFDPLLMTWIADDVLQTRHSTTTDLTFIWLL